MRKPEDKSITITMRVRPSLKARAEAAAKADRRSLTGYIESLIAKDVEGRASTAFWKSRAGKELTRKRTNRASALEAKGHTVKEAVVQAWTEFRPPDFAA